MDYVPYYYFLSHKFISFNYYNLNNREFLFEYLTYMYIYHIYCDNILTGAVTSYNSRRLDES